MNGRVYDYNLGRFMSVDPFVQSPGNSQSINPYSYIMNNPLAGTDPTGYEWRDAQGDSTPATERNQKFDSESRQRQANKRASNGSGSAELSGQDSGARTGQATQQPASGQNTPTMDKMGPQESSNSERFTNKDRRAAADSNTVYDTEGGFDSIGIDYEPVKGFGAMLTDNKDGTFNVAYRGTDEAGDNKSNIRNAFGLSAEQYDYAIELAQMVVMKLGVKNVTFTGHSLGGGMASAAAFATGSNAITFNTAGLNEQYITNRSPNIRAHIIVNDYLSLNQNFNFLPVGRALPDTVGNRIYHMPSQFDPHSIKNFTER